MVARVAEVLAGRLVSAMGDMSLAELARKTGLNRQQVHRYVNGQAIPRADSYMKICGALGLDPWSGVSDETEPSDQRLNLTETLGNAQDPDPEQFPPGLYELFSTHPNALATLTRVILVIKYVGVTCTLRAMLSPDYFPVGAPSDFRRLDGIVKVKFGQSYYMTWQNRQIAGTDEKLYVTTMLGAVQSGGTIRRGVAMRYLPNASSEPIASKVALRFLPDTGYRAASRAPAMLRDQDAPDDVKSYFFSRSEYPYHFGPFFEQDVSHPASAPVRASLDASKAPDLLTEALGGGVAPSEAELESGVYEIFMPFALDQNTIMRMPVKIGSDAQGRCIYSRMPKRHFPPDVPSVVRALSGKVVMKFGTILHIFGVVDRGDGLDKQSYYFRFGMTDFRTGNRYGLGLFPDRTTQAPMAMRAVMSKSRQSTFARAYRHSVPMTVENAPQSVREYFAKEEFSPYILSTGAHPLFF